MPDQNAVYIKYQNHILIYHNVNVLIGLIKNYLKLIVDILRKAL